MGTLQHDWHLAGPGTLGLGISGGISIFYYSLLFTSTVHIFYVVDYCDFCLGSWEFLGLVQSGSGVVAHAEYHWERVTWDRNKIDYVSESIDMRRHRVVGYNAFVDVILSRQKRVMWDGCCVANDPCLNTQP